MGLPSMMHVRRPPTVVLVAPPVNPHRMVTRVKAGFRVLPDCLVLATTTSSPMPSLIMTSIWARGDGG
jgi:aspartate-semialdehyde dehydrogenase